MKKIATKLAEVFVIEPIVHRDHRGYFMESYNEQIWRQQLGVAYEFVQDNESLTYEPGVIRGLHYQLQEKAQTKLVRVMQGAVYDVVVDIRRGSPTFGQWIGVILSEQNQRQIIVPQGFAHGICTLLANTRLLYKVDQYYSAEHDRGIAWNDPSLGIIWPTSDPVLSAKDEQQPLLEQADNDFIYEEERE